jgi:tetratricopeptide (TPR) repeat protein
MSMATSFAEDLLKKAESYLVKGEYKVAEGIVEKFFHDVPEKDRVPALLMRAHLIAARALTYRAQYIEAIRHCLDALRTAEKSSDVKTQAWSMRWLGYIHWRMGDFHKALENEMEGLRRARMAGEKELEGMLHVDMGSALVGLGESQKGDAEYHTAISILESVPGSSELSRAYNNLGDKLKQDGEWEKAAVYFQKCKDTSGDNISRRAWGGFNKAECLMETGRLDEARRELDEAIPLIEKSGDSYGRAVAYKYLGLLNGKTKDWSEAKRNLELARDLARQNAMPVAEAKVLRDMGRMYVWKGDGKMARKCMEKARSIFKEHGATVEVERVEKMLAEMTK